MVDDADAATRAVWEKALRGGWPRPRRSSNGSAGWPSRWPTPELVVRSPGPRPRPPAHGLREQGPAGRPQRGARVHQPAHGPADREGSVRPWRDPRSAPRPRPGQGMALATEPERVELLAHELAHLLGAAHSPDPLSLARPTMGDGKARSAKFRIGLDPLNLLAVGIWVEELRSGEVKEWGDLRRWPGTRLRAVYKTIARTLPDDPIARESVARLDRLAPGGATSRRPSGPALTAKQQAVRKVVRAVAFRAADLSRQPEAERPKGDELTAELVRTAASVAATRRRRCSRPPSDRAGPRPGRLHGPPRQPADPQLLPRGRVGRGASGADWPSSARRPSGIGGTCVSTSRVGGAGRVDRSGRGRGGRAAQGTAGHGRGQRVQLRRLGGRPGRGRVREGGSQRPPCGRAVRASCSRSRNSSRTWRGWPRGYRRRSSRPITGRRRTRVSAKLLDDVRKRVARATWIQQVRWVESSGPDRSSAPTGR